MIDRGEGSLLFEEGGHALIDAIASWWVNLHGHSHPAIAKALADQAQTLEHVIFAGFQHRPAATLATRLVALLPWTKRVFFSDNGSTAVEVGLKMALQYWHNQGQARTKFIAFAGGYHGDTFGAMAVGDGGTFSAPFQKLFFPTEKVPFPTNANFAAVRDRFAKLCATGEIAGFVYEPIVQGVAGFRMCDPEQLESLLQIAKQAGVLCIADEVMTGFGRTGPLFASELCATKPDLVCLSKGITGGTMPLAVTACTDEVFQMFLSEDADKAFYHGHSYTANPLACRVANVSLDLLLSDSCQTRRSAIAARFQAERERFQNLPKIKNARSRGCLFAMDLDTGSDSYFNTVRTKVGPFFRERGILLRPLGNTLYLVPPYCLKDTELDHIFAAMEEFVCGLE